MAHYTPSDDKSTPVENHTDGLGFQEFLHLVEAQGSYPQWKGKCPVHDDKRHSLSIKYDDETTKVLVKCFVCGPEFIGGLKLRGYWPIGTPNDQALKHARSAQKNTKTTYQWVPKGDGAPPEPKELLNHRVAGMWEYRDLENDLIGRVIRYDELAEPEPGQKQGKQFRPQFCFMTDKGPTWMMKAPTVRPLYNLPSLHLNGVVLLVEGEKTADRAQELFPTMAVVSPQGGLQGLAKTDLSVLAGRDIIVWSDADSSWENNVVAWNNVLTSADCKSVAYVKLPDRLVAEHNKWDLADEIPSWLNIEELLDHPVLFKVLDKDPVRSIKRAEDLKLKYAIVGIGGQDHRFIHLDSGFKFTMKVFDAMFRNLTTPRDLGLPSRYYMDAKDRHPGFADIDYVPGGDKFLKREGNEYFNVYRPTEVIPRSGNVKPFVEHLEWLLNDEDRQELMCRFANMVQHPKRRPLSAYVLQGSQGLGKNILFDALAPLVGRDNYSIVPPDAVTQAYNYYTANKVYLVFNEMTDYEKHELYDKLKPLITDEDIMVRQKYMPDYWTKNYTHIFCMTNYARPIRLPDENERRFYIAEAVPKAPKDQDYYDKFMSWRSTHTGELFHYLLNFDLGSWSPEARPKMTEAKEKVIKLSQPIGEQVYAQMLRDGEFSYDAYISVEFARVLSNSGVLHSEKQFSKMHDLIKKYGGEVILAARPKPGGQGLDVVKLVILKGLEDYQKLSKSDMWKKYLSTRTAGYGDESF